MINFLLLYSNMSFLQVPEHQISSKPKSKEGFRRVYTSQNDDIPTQLSYQSIKLANFIQLELTDLWDSLQQITEQNFKNQLKQSLSRSYNAFHQMQKLYSDLGMNFLYSQTKKLISSYGIIFVHMMQIIEKYEKKSQEQKSIEKQTIKQVGNPFQKQVKQAIDKIIHNKQVKQIKNYKRLRGIHLFNQSYARCIDYDVQSFKRLRQKLRESQKTQQQKQKSKIQQQRKFKKQVIEQLNDFSHMKVDGEELYLFLSRQKKINQISTKFSLQDQLQKIAAYFKQSQHQALQFLRKQKNLQSFHELTQGFNLIVSDYENNKAQQFSYVQDKIKEIFQYINKKIKFYETVIDQKDKQIQNLKQINSNKKLYTVDNQSQTYHNFDEEIKQLAKRVVTTEMINSQLKILLQKTSEQDRKQKNTLLQQISMKESSCRQFRDVIEQKINYIVKIQRKVKILNENNKTKNIKDPIQFFNGLSDQMKRNFFEQLKQQGFIQNNRAEDRKISLNKNPKLGKTNESLLDKKEPSNMESKGTQSPTRQLKKRQSSLFKRSSSKEWNSKTSTIERKSRNIGYNEDQDNINSQLRAYKDTVQEKEIFRSKKLIRHAPNQVNGQKPRVFDLKDKTGFEYSHKNIEGDETYQKKINLSNQSSNYGKSSLQSSLTNIIAQNNEQNIQEHEQNYQKNHKGIIKNYNKQQSINRSIKIIQNCEKIRFQEGITLNNDQQNKTVQQREALDHKDQILNNDESPQRYEDTKIIDQHLPRSQTKSKSKSRKMIRYEDQQNLISNSTKIKNQNQKQKQNENEQFKIQIKKKNSFQSQKYENDPEKNNIIKPEELKQEKNNRIPTCNSAKSVNRRRQKNRMRMKVSNEYNLTITNTPIMSSKVIKDLSNLEKIKQDKKDKLKKTNKIEQNPTKRQMKDAEKHQKNQREEEIKNYMRNTAKRINKTQTFQQIGGDYENRQTKTIIKNKENIKHNSHQSLTNTFHKNTNERKHQRNIQSQILTHQKTKQSEEDQNKRESFLQDNVKNNATLIKSTESEAIKKLIEEEFGQEEVILASRGSASVQQFKEKVIKIHVKRCGQKCQHLQRFLQIFKKLRRESSNKRQVIKIHIENMNEKLGESFSNGFNLPFIKK